MNTTAASYWILSDARASRLAASEGTSEEPPVAMLASGSDRERAMATLVTAFAGDPFIRWMFPDALQYLTYFPQLLRFFGGRAFEHGAAYRTADFQAAALWLPPGVGPDVQALWGVLMKGVEPRLHSEVFTVFENLGKSHPAFPHWHLPVIGVDPRYQGKAYGSALLGRGLEVCDQDHVAAYLEAINPANVALYRRFGFEVVAEIQHASSPVITTMLRPAR